MSETERNIGTMIPKVFPGYTLEAQARAACDHYGYEWNSSWYEDWVQCLSENGYREIYIHNDIIYELQNTRSFDIEDPNRDIVNATINDDDSISYDLQWYNGGGSFDEVLESALKRINPYERSNE